MRPAVQCHSAAGKLEVLSVGDPGLLCRPCVDCGLRTGRFCDGDGCLAAVRVPSEQWAPGQMTPFCSHCEAKRPFCHFCEGKAWATPPVWPDEEGRSEDDDEGWDLQSDSEERLPSENDDASGDGIAESDATEGWTYIPP